MNTGLPDAALRLELFCPPAGQTALLKQLDLGVDTAAFSNQWRQGVLRISWPALPNHVNQADNLTFTLVDSGDYGASYQAGSTNIGAAWMLPEITVSVPGVADTGAPPGYCDFPMPPALRGPVGVQVTSPASSDNQAALLVAQWYLG